MIALAAIFGLVSRVCGCSASDAAQDNDASTDDANGAGCESLADFCASVSCPSTLADADDAGTWASFGPQPNCYILQSSNVCSGQIEIAQRGGVDTAETFFYDQASGALVGASRIINLKTTCGGTIGGGNCDDSWMLAPLFGVLDAGACFGNGVDAGSD
jgi:hypothetical protein